MKKLFALMGLFLAGSLWAQAPKPPEPINLADYAKLDFDIYGTAAYRGIGKGPAVLGAGLGATYWLTRNLGGGVRAESDNWAHSSVDRAGVRFTVRGDLWGLVPYGFLGAFYDFENRNSLNERWIVQAGGGLQKNLVKNAGVFAEGAMETTSSGHSTSRAALGIRFSLF